MGITERKYALSPQYAEVAYRGRGLANGGPQALVSSPVVGFSIFMTSALWSALTSRDWTPSRREFASISFDGHWRVPCSKVPLIHESSHIL
jgi:hypothetical protein